MSVARNDAARSTHKKSRRVGRQLTAVGAALAMGAVVPATSQADAYGVQYWAPFSVNLGGQTIGIPSGQLAHLIQGSGTFVTTDGANFGSAANVCDSSMRFTYGNGAQRINGNVHWGCSKVGQWKYTLNRNVPRGDACAELWGKNWWVRIAQQCHYVHG